MGAGHTPSRRSPRSSASAAYDLPSPRAERYLGLVIGAGEYGHSGFPKSSAHTPSHAVTRADDCGNRQTSHRLGVHSSTPTGSSQEHRPARLMALRKRGCSGGLVSLNGVAGASVRG